MTGSRLIASCTVFLAACGGSARLGGDGAEGPTVVMPARFAEGDNSKKVASPAPSAAASAGAGDAGTGTGTRPANAPPPDPPPLVTRTQWLYRFVYKKGSVIVAGVTKKEFERPVPTERRVGRFAVELWVGRELVDRVRFDFPLLAADPAPDSEKHPLRQPTPFGPGAETSRDVAVPASERVTRAVLVDRLNGHTIPLAWPPDAKGPEEEGESPATPPSR